MDAIERFLDDVFKSLPDTTQAHRAKADILASLQDRFEALVAEGHSEAEALGLVIQEFGTTEELARELDPGDDAAPAASAQVGTEDAPAPQPPARELTKTELETFVDARRRMTRVIPPAVATIIAANGFSAPATMFDDASGFRTVFASGFRTVFVALASVLVAGAIGALVYAGIQASGTRLPEEGFRLLNEDQLDTQVSARKFRSKFAAMVATGVVLCVLSIALSEAAYSGQTLTIGWLMPVAALPVALGVALFIRAGLIRGTYRRLLEPGYPRPESWEDAADGRPEWAHSAAWGNVWDPNTRDPATKRMALWAGVYWPVVTLIYVLISFPTESWHVTWIIWPVAALLWVALIALARVRQSRRAESEAA
jgi:hypothetical protein